MLFVTVHLKPILDENIRGIVEKPPYKGAKPSFLIEDRIEDRDRISNLIGITEKELPIPRPKSKKTKKYPK
jgi:hypothetical protein